MRSTALPSGASVSCCGDAAGRLLRWCLSMICDCWKIWMIGRICSMPVLPWLRQTRRVPSRSMSFFRTWDLILSDDGHALSRSSC